MPPGPTGRSPPHAGAEPHRVGSFELIEELGRGGMGVVFRARDLQLEREVALKRPRLHLLEHPDFRSRFMGEARASSKLMHPNIVTVFEVLEDNGVPWLVMELIDGASLRRLLSGHRPLPMENTIQHAEGLTDALRLAHTGGVLHRDIKPLNILVGKDGRARLSDFGLARAQVEIEDHGEFSEDSTEDGTTGGIVGTRGYMAPEQALGRPVDSRSDVFSLGVVFYEMCTGEPAFARPGSSNWLDALLHREPPSIVSLNAEVPSEFESVVRKAIAKRPFQRYQSANEMLLDIRAVRRQLESSSDAAWHGFVQRSRQKRIWYGIAGLGVAAIITFGVLQRVSNPSNPGPALGPTHQRLTAEPGWEGEPALAPDGSMIAYCSDQSGNLDIWIVPPSGGDPLQLTTNPASESNPAWHPDGSKIFFVSDRGGDRGIWRVPFLGGVPVLLVPNAEDPAISPDGQQIAFARSGPTGELRIHVAPLDDPSNARLLTDDDHGLWDHENPTWSPDGLTLCYADFRDLWLVPLDNGPPRKLTTKDARDDNPAWSPDGQYIFFASGRDNTLALWRVGIEGGEPERLTAGTGDEGEPSLSRDGRWLAYATRNFNPDIVVLDRQTETEERVTGATIENEPAIASDGSSVVFMSDRRGPFDLWLQPFRDGLLDGPPRQLTDHPGIAAVPSFSPDGRWLAYFRVLGGQLDIWILPVTGGLPRKFTDHPSTDIHPSFSPDGTRLAFVSDRKGFENIWLAEVADGQRSGEPWQLTHGEAAHWFPSWSPDGRRIAYTVDQGFHREVFIVDLDSDTPPVQLTRGARALRAVWGPSGDELLVSGVWSGDRLTLRWLAVADGASRPFKPELELGPEDSNAGLFTLDREGRFLAYVVDERKGDVWLAKIVAGR
jgi:Tol biopolymer transport system component/serine/threonine protein kinase